MLGNPILNPLFALYRKLFIARIVSTQNFYKFLTWMLLFFSQNYSELRLMPFSSSMQTNRQHDLCHLILVKMLSYISLISCYCQYPPYSAKFENLSAKLRLKIQILLVILIFNIYIFVLPYVTP